MSTFDNDKPTSEDSYISELYKVMTLGEIRDDRTGTGTLSLFGRRLEFDLTQGFPLLTTKKLPFKHIVHELFWFLSGSTSTSYLQECGVKIWEKNSSEEFIRSRGLDYQEGTVGPLYGFQWRNFGGSDGKKGVDQIDRVLKILKTDPTSRRMVISAWNPCDLDKMVLEPCHILFQLYVRQGKYLDGSLYMRSNDLFLGAPWNIACYSLLLSLYAHLSGYIPGKLVYTVGDAHIYMNHLTQVREQVGREPRPLPKLVIKERGQKVIDDFEPEDISIVDYQPWPGIKADMAI